MQVPARCNNSKEFNPSDDISFVNKEALQMIYTYDFLYNDEIVNYGFTKPGDLLKKIYQLMKKIL